MFLGRVIGEVWATKKLEDLNGKRLLLIQPVDDADDPIAPKVGPVVAADPLGADMGERVVVAFGKAARVAFGGDGDYAFEAAVVGIVDALESPLHPSLEEEPSRKPLATSAALKAGRKESD